MRRSRGGPDGAFPYLGEGDRFAFPDPCSADAAGIVCVGGNLSPGMLLSAYRQGLFPWFNEGDPIYWWSPDPRFVLFPGELHCSESMKKVLRRGDFELALDRDFRGVIEHCAAAARPGQDGTWITGDMIEAYCAIARLGWAHSAEAYAGGRLLGGLYGVCLGSVFFGESMFSLAPNASKAAFIALVWALADLGFGLVDSQVRTAHLASLGAREIPRADYLSLLGEGLSGTQLNGDWSKLVPGFPDSAGYRAARGERG
jgi:leucyl/phenylalanyl-tRNA---protein transferase